MAETDCFSIRPHGVIDVAVVDLSPARMSGISIQIATQ